MSKTFIPEGYVSSLNLHETQIGIKTVKDVFQDLLAERLNLRRVSAPLFVTPESGLNDNLNGVERPVSFDILHQNRRQAEIVHSLAKWKRYALQRYGFSIGEGLYTDMSAIRRDEETDNIHSIYVDQWDWEKIITKEDRTLDTFVMTVVELYDWAKRRGALTMELGVEVRDDYHEHTEYVNIETDMLDADSECNAIVAEVHINE